MLIHDSIYPNLCQESGGFNGTRRYTHSHAFPVKSSFLVLRKLQLFSTIIYAGRLPEFQNPVEVPSCVVAKSILMQRAQKMDLPPNFLDEISKHCRMMSVSYHQV